MDGWMEGGREGGFEGEREERTFFAGAAGSSFFNMAALTLACVR